MLPDLQSPAISRTMQYKKVTKPLLERKRRARINKCLDELKDLMMGALEADGENVSKLEKADILELTVRHLQRIHQPRDALEDAQKFQAGFGQCATEACKFLLSVPGVDTRVGHNLFKHLGACISSCPLAIQAPSLGKGSTPSPLSSPTAAPHSPPQKYPQSAFPSLPSYRNQDAATPKDYSLSSSSNCLKELAQNSMEAHHHEDGVHQSAKGVLRNVILERRKHAALNAVDDENGADMEAEIDVERVEERPEDMWRPW